VLPTATVLNRQEDIFAMRETCTLAGSAGKLGREELAGLVNFGKLSVNTAIFSASTER
jgi:hypothetical protein